MLVAAIVQSGHANPIVQIVRKAWNESLVPSIDPEVIAEEAIRIVTQGMTFKMRMEVPMRLLRKPLPLFKYPHCGGSVPSGKGGGL